MFDRLARAWEIVYSLCIIAAVRNKPKRIYVVGMSASGKSTLAQLLSVKLDCKCIGLDSLYWDLKKTLPGKQVLRSIEDRERRITRLTNKDEWVLDGIYLEDKLFASADLIIFLQQSLLRSLFWQWRRYFQDPVQQEVYGLKNNLNLSKIILMQHDRARPGFTFDGYYYSTMYNLKKYLCTHYKEKLLVCSGTNYKPILEKIGIMHA